MLETEWTAQHDRSQDRASKSLEDGTAVGEGQNQLVISLAVERVDYERQQAKNCQPSPLETISLCSPGWTGTCYVNQIGFELTGIRLSLPPECSD